MKHSDLKVGMKVKRVNMFSDRYFPSTKGNISTVKEIKASLFSTCEDSDCSWEAQYFEPVIEEQTKENILNKIDMNKKYRTRCGYPVRVLCTDMKKNDWPVVCIVEFPDGSEVANNVTIYGKEWGNEEQELDLIEVSPWEDFKKDDKVMVRTSEDEPWYKRHFAYEKDSKAYCYADGATSWTGDGCEVPWEYCRKPTKEELGEE